MPGRGYFFEMRFFLSGALALLLAGCTASDSGPAAGKKEGDAAFNAIADEYIRGFLAWRPQTGTALGLHEYDGKVTDFSASSIAGELSRLKSSGQRLDGFPTNTLSQRGLYDFRILRASIEREVFGFEQMRSYFRNPMTYAGSLDVNIYVKRDFAPLPERVRSLVAILKQAPALVAAARQNLEQALPRPQVEVAIRQAEGAADFLAKDMVAALAPLQDAELQSQFQAANNVAIAEMRRFAQWLKEERLPKADDSYHLGREKYVTMLRSGEMVTRSPEQLLELGMRELRQAQQRFAETAREIDPSKTPVEVFAAIQKDHPTEQRLIPDTARGLEKIRQFLIDKHIITIPSPVRARVEETPQYLRATGFASMDTPGPFETRATQAYYYVTPTEPDWTPAQKEEWLTAFNYYTTEVVSIHEAYPGHYVQFLCLNASPANRLEKMFTSYAFTEGWAHYAEQMMIEQGYGSGPGNTQAGTENVRAAKYRLAQLDEALLRLCRFCVSIQMHSQGMSVDEATRFFRDNCYYEEKPAREEAQRGAYDPEYLYYTLGKLELLKLRKDYQREQGTAFDLQKFHDELLRHGAPPVRLLREVMLRSRTEWDQVL